MVHRRSNESAGFTLLELMIVVVIIGILASIAVPTLINYRTKAKNALAVFEIKILEQKIIFFDIENMRLPDVLSEVKLGNMKDPWGNPYQYLKIAEDEKKNKPRKDHFQVPVNSDFDLYSMGKDGKSRAFFTAKASHDDIVRASDGKFFGLVTEF